MSWEEYRSNYMREQERADSWRDFERRFMELAREEQGRTDAITKGETIGRIDRVLRASCNYAEHPEGWERGKPNQGMICLLHTPQHGVWNYSSDGISENFRERARLCVAEAGRALSDYPEGADAEDFWLHRLYLDLLKNNSDLLFCGTKEGGMILSVCVASATFCARLQRQAIQPSEPGSTKGTDHHRVGGNQTESSRAQNSAQSMQKVECKSENAEPSKTPEAFIDRAIASRNRMLESFGMPEEARKGNLPPALDAEQSRALLGIELARLEHLRHGVWKKLFDEASIPRVVEAEWQSVLSLRKMPDSHVDLGLTFALTKEYQKAISRASAQLADLLATAAGSRINQAHLREAIWRECLDFAYQLGNSLDDKRQKVAENDIPNVLECWDHRRDAKFQQKRAQRLADLQKQIAPLKKDRLEHHAIIHRLKFEEAVSKTADKARDAREKAETELAELQSRMTPLQTEINQLTRHFWVTKDQVKANKYDLSASRYRQIEQDEEFYEEPKVTLERLLQLEAAAKAEIAILQQTLPSHKIDR